MPALLTRTSMVPNVVMNSANIFLTAPLSETSATSRTARPPARSSSVTTFCAASERKSLTPTLAPSRANTSAISRPSPEPAPVISTAWSLSFTATSAPPQSFPRHALLELGLPVQPPRLRTRFLCFLFHPLFLIEHAQVGEREDVLGLLRDILSGQLDRGVEVALGLV